MAFGDEKREPVAPLDTNEGIRQEKGAEKSNWDLVKEKTRAFGRRLMGATESRLLPQEVERMQKMQGDADTKLSELYKKANNERTFADVQGVDIIEHRWRYFASFVNAMKKKFPDDFELWASMNLYFDKLDRDYRGSVRFTDFGFLHILNDLGLKDLPLLKYSFMTLAEVNENYAEYFYAHAGEFGPPAVFPEVYELIIDYAKKAPRGEIHVEDLKNFISKRLNPAPYR